MTDDSVYPSPTALRALAHPVRLRLLGLLRTEGPATATQLARRLDLNSGATSYHLRQLAEHGFVTDDPDRGTGRERWWRAAHRSTRVPVEYDEEPAAGDAREAFGQAVAMTYTDQIQRAVEQQSTLPDPWRLLTIFSDWTLRLTPAEALRMLEEVEAVVERYRQWDPEDTEAPAQAGAYRLLLSAFPRTSPPADGDLP